MKSALRKHFLKRVLQTEHLGLAIIATARIDRKLWTQSSELMKYQ